MKIEVGKYYRTREGDKAYILTTTTPDKDYPVAGYIIYDNKVLATTWTLTGNVRLAFTDLQDLVAEWEEPKPRRIAYLDITTGIAHFVHNTAADFKYSQDNRYIRMPHLDEPESK